MRYDSTLSVAGREISIGAPTYFIADIASNHDGDIGRAKELIWKAKEAGADAAKFQHFLAARIVSDHGFRTLGSQMAHQAKWKDSVYRIYERYETPREWTQSLVETAAKAGIHFMTTPYDAAAIDEIDPHLPAYKIGSGDITWTQSLVHVAGKGKPVMLATGASEMDEVIRAVDAILAVNPRLALLQCNTNYTGSLENFTCVNLNVLRTFAVRWPNMVLGLSDHTPGHATVLGAVALGARIIEKHFTDDTGRDGPDHAFSMDPRTWREMVDRTRELEAALGDGVKRVEANERDSAVVQRRCLRFARAMAAGEVVRPEDIEALRPAPAGSLAPWRLDEVVGRPLTVGREAGDFVRLSDVGRGVEC